MSAFANPFTSGIKPNLSNASGINPFTANSNAAGGSAFGQPSFGASTMAGGAGSSTFGVPQFGASTSNTGNATTSAFNGINNAAQSSAFGTPAFGSSAPANTNAPSTSSAFGAPSFGSSGFGSTAAAGNHFTKAPSSMGSAFGQAGFGVNGTAAASSATNNSDISAFGAIQNKPLTSASPFGSLQQDQAQNPSSTSSAFGKPAFTTTSNTQSPFGAIQNTSANAGTGAAPFGSFGANSNNKSPFGNLQSGASPGFGLANFKANISNNSDSSGNSNPFGSTDNQGSSNQSSFASGAAGTFRSAPNSNAYQNTAFQSRFGNKGFSFGISSDANKTPQTSSLFGQTAPNTNANPISQNNGGPASFGFGQQPMKTTNNCIKVAPENTGFVQGLPSEKDGILELTDLAEETLNIFKASKFELGLVPDIPPPPVLVT
ncbi:Nup42p [Saccharomyces cerevisiae x Saccharomyces kudriavzevii VIN7]|uniref:Nup42p n=1 Tax=Saccharomyces cerevisiae x Saccharomyces kudriavzevii (strain VIN7) TaxID=1095631 RepID=H0GSW5_SACCK|nr:Nup42p [Saccharomyces cerevisiae x Saccharomyces kudriavzevii VIN7]